MHPNHTTNAPRSTTALFWKKVDRRGPDECWNWTASRYTSGYGQFWTGTKLVGAHRYSYELHHGPIPNGLWVLHHCDNKLCCNPTHLWAGTAQENITDMHQKGRNNQPRNERQRSARFTNDQVRELRKLYATGRYGRQDLAHRFGVTVPTIRSIVLRMTYRDV